MASITNRVNEANKFMETGHKHLKTGLFKWAPDHDSAGYQFQQAAMAFKGAGLQQKAIEACDLAIKSYLATQNSAFQAAKCMEQAALCHKELGDFQSSSKYYMRAIDVYRTTGQMDTAINTMDRAAKSLAEKLPTLAADIYIQASEACAIEDRYRQAAEFCSKSANLYLKSKEYVRAANILKEEYNCYSQVGDSRHNNRIVIQIILCHLTNKDIVAAMDVLKSYQMDDETYGLANNLVTGYDKRDGSMLEPTLKNSLFVNLDSEYGKLARDIKNLYPAVKIDPNQKVGATPDNPEIEDEDENLLL